MFFGLVGLNQVYFSCCGGYFFGWHEFWMVGNEGLGMEAVGWELNVTETTLTSIVQPTTTCEAWIVKTPMRIFIVVAHSQQQCLFNLWVTGDSRMQINENRNEPRTWMLLLGCKAG